MPSTLTSSKMSTIASSTRDVVEPRRWNAMRLSVSAVSSRDRYVTCPVGPLTGIGLSARSGKLAHRARQFIRRLRAIVELREHHRRVVRILQYIIQDMVRAREQLHHCFFGDGSGPRASNSSTVGLMLFFCFFEAVPFLPLKEILDCHIILSSLRISIIAESGLSRVKKQCEVCAVIDARQNPIPWQAKIRRHQLHRHPRDGLLYQTDLSLTGGTLRGRLAGDNCSCHLQADTVS